MWPQDRDHDNWIEDYVKQIKGVYPKKTEAKPPTKTYLEYAESAHKYKQHRDEEFRGQFESSFRLAGVHIEAPRDSDDRPIICADVTLSNIVRLEGMVFALQHELHEALEKIKDLMAEVFDE